MADRLLADVRQSRSRTLLTVGVGRASSTHEALLYNGALLAPQVGRVLLVDGDAGRRPLTLELEFGERPGLAELLRGSGPPAKHCQPTDFENVWLLPAGMLAGQPLAHCGSRLGELLHELSAEFDLILVDGGRTDDGAACMWARLCDATYFVVPLGRVEAREAQGALRDFRAAGARVLGCIAG